jgi:GTPase SAR1 family protein
VTLWDTGGQERYESMTANYYRNAHAVILVFGVDEEGTLYALNEVVGEAKDTCRQSDNLVLALWGSKSDLPSHMHTVKQDAIDAFLTTHAIPKTLHCKVTVLDNSVEDAMRTLIQHVDACFNRVDRPLPADAKNKEGSFITLDRQQDRQSNRHKTCNPNC